MVTLTHVWKTYQRGDQYVHALRDVSVHVAKGQCCVLMGPSGSGKSTFLHVIAGLETVTTGDLWIEGVSTKNFSDLEWTRLRRDVVGMVFQAFHLLPGLTAAENVGLPLQLKGLPRRMIRERVQWALEAVGMGHRAHHRPSELSGGEQQRVAIARAIVHGPRLVLADEPTGNLDSCNAEAIMTLLRTVTQGQGQTLIVATHSPAAASLADHLYLMADGSLHQATSTISRCDLAYE